jgi:MYXO-CTERM domain-containing protein
VKKRGGDDGCAIDPSQRDAASPLWLIVGLLLAVWRRRAVR